MKEDCNISSVWLCIKQQVAAEVKPHSLAEDSA